MTDYTFCEQVHPFDSYTLGGDAVMWRSRAWGDGSPVTPFWSASRETLMLVDVCTASPWLMTFHAGSNSFPAVAPVLHVGALATVLSDLVERVV